MLNNNVIPYVENCKYLGIVIHSQTTLCIPKSSKCNISISNGPVAFKFYTEVKYLKLHIKMVNDKINTQTAFVDDTFVSPKSSKLNTSISNGPIAFKLYTEVKCLKVHTQIDND